jgi:hypothetical protein
MSEMFGVDISGILADATDGQLFDVTVTRYVAGEREAGNLTGGRAKVPQTVTGIQGFWEDFTGQPPPGIEVELNDRKACLIGDTIPVGGQPMKNDAIEIEGQTLFMVQLMSRDPASALYVYQCRDRRGPDGV